MLDHRLSIAPMVGWTDRYYRYMMRLFTKKTVLYTEMVVDSTIIHNQDRDRFLAFDKVENPIVCQIAGSDTKKMTETAIICQKYGYDEININVGCPSDKVQKGCFGLVLMKEPKLVRDIAKNISNEIDIPLTIKCRIGVDELDSYEYLYDFIETTSNQTNVKHYIIHARKGILNLSSQQNRTIPELNYDFVYRLINDFPELKFSINGGIKSLEQARDLLSGNDGLPKIFGVMIGRSAWSDPFMFADADSFIFGEENVNISREDVVSKYIDFAEIEQKEKGVSNHLLLKPLLNIYHSQKNGRNFRKILSENMNDRKQSVRDIFDKVLEMSS